MRRAIWRSAVCCVHGGSGVHGLGAGGLAPTGGRSSAGAPPSRQEESSRERPGAKGVTQERPSRRETAGFVGVAPGITGGAFSARPVCHRVRSVQPGRRFPGSLRRPRCDSGLDSSRWVESRSGAAQKGVQGSARRGPRSSSPGRSGVRHRRTIARCGARAEPASRPKPRAAEASAASALTPVSTCGTMSCPTMPSVAASVVLARSPSPSTPAAGCLRSAGTTEGVPTA